MIEAVFEDPSLKHQVFAEIAGHVNADALLCSNTSTLPISELATGVDRPADFIGLHFFMASRDQEGTPVKSIGRKAIRAPARVVQVDLDDPQPP